MRFEGRTRTYPNPSTDLSSEANSTWRFCKTSSGNIALVSVAGAESVGVLINKPGVGVSAQVQYTGIARVRASAAIAEMAKVSSANDGRAKTAATTEVAHGVALTAAVSANDLIDVLLTLNSYKV